MHALDLSIPIVLTDDDPAPMILLDMLIQVTSPAGMRVRGEKGRFTRLRIAT